MVEELNKHITCITVEQGTYILDKINMVFTHVDINFKITVNKLSTKEDFKEIYNRHKENFKLLKIEIPEELEQWFKNTYISIS